ncbi:MAG: hypothetical protein AVDCRST_MAG11-1704, partial [uncultured Gemmatimonadaceae bacterium]
CSPRPPTPSSGRASPSPRSRRSRGGPPSAARARWGSPCSWSPGWRPRRPAPGRSPRR